MTETIPVAVPRKGRPLEAVLDRLASRVEDSHHDPEGHGGERSAGSLSSSDGESDGVDVASLADSISSILRYEKAIAKGEQTPTDDVYERLASYSDLSEPGRPEYTLLRDDREGRPRRIVFDSVTIPLGEVDLQLIGREEPFRALRTHEFALGFDSADLVLEEVVELRSEPLDSIDDVNARIDPRDTDVRVVTGLGDTVYHTLMGTPAVRRQGPGDEIDRSFVEAYEGPLCISPRYERLVEAVLGTDAVDGVEFCYPENGREEEAAIADAGLGVYLTVTGSTARSHGLELGERLFPSETVLMKNVSEATDGVRLVADLFAEQPLDSALTI